MAAGYSDLYLEQGTSFTTQLTLADTNGLAYNLSHFSVSSQARKSYYSANATINFVSTIYDSANGIIQLSANSSVTSGVRPGRLVYDVIISDSSNNVTRVLEGQIYVSPSVTR
jgi:hypothetical protein